MHRLLRTRLQLEQVEIHCVASGTEGIATARAMRPDVVLLDIDLPDMDGFEVLHRLKEDPRTRDIAVIFVSANHETMNRVKSLDLGAIDFVQKPFEMAELKARVRSALRIQQLLRMLAQRAQLDGLTAITTRAVNIATANGLVCLTAAGNSGHDADPATLRIIAPADALEVIACGATDANGATAGFSSDGPSADGRVKPEVLARGVAVASVHSTNATGYQAVSGTSLSTPLVAGAAALLMQARPELGVAALRTALFTTAEDFVLNATTDPAFVRGYGVISAVDAAKTNRAAEDTNLDGAVNAQDLAVLLSQWGSCSDPDPETGFCISDFNADGSVDAPRIRASRRPARSCRSRRCRTRRSRWSSSIRARRSGRRPARR